MQPRSNRMWLSYARYFLAGIVCISALAYWKRSDSSEAEKRISIIKSRGEPWEFADFAQPPVPADENAAHIYIKACHHINLNNEMVDCLLDLRNLPLTPDNATKADAILKQNSEALQLWRRATRMPKLNWECPMQIVKNDIEFKASYISHIKLGGMGSLALLARAMALRTYEQGHEAEALDIIESILATGDALYQVPSLMALSPANGTEFHAISALHQIAWNLQLNPSNSPEVRARIVNMINTLLNEESLVHHYQNQLFSDRLVLYHHFNLILGADKKARGVAEARFMIWDYVSQAAHAQTYPEFLKITFPTISQMPLGNGLIYSADKLRSWLESERGLGNDNLIKQHFLVLANRRMAAIALAIRLYVIDHGQLPSDLSELVDQGYITHIPKDPMLASSTIGYIAYGEHPRLYSAGDNAIDDGGSIDMPNQNKEYFSRSKTLDFPFFLTQPVKENIPIWPRGQGGWGGTLSQSTTSQHPSQK